MGIRDQRIDWLRKRLWLTPWDIQGVGLLAESNATLFAFQTLTSEYKEFNSLGMGAVIMVAGEIVTGYIRCPYDLDSDFPVGFRVGYTVDHDGTGAATVEWILLQNAIAEGIVLAVATTALTKVLGTDSYLDSDGAAVVTDYLSQMSNRGIRNSIGLTRDQIENCAYLTFSLECQAVANVTTVRVLGMEMDYVPLQTQGTGHHIDCGLQSDGLN